MGGAVTTKWVAIILGGLCWSSLMAGLDCGLDCWTGLLDWITGLTFELKLCVSHDLHPIRCAELCHMFDA